MKRFINFLILSIVVLTSCQDDILVKENNNNIDDTTNIVVDDVKTISDYFNETSVNSDGSFYVNGEIQYLKDYMLNTETTKSVSRKKSTSNDTTYISDTLYWYSVFGYYCDTIIGYNDETQLNDTLIECRDTWKDFYINIDTINIDTYNGPTIKFTYQTCIKYNYYDDIDDTTYEVEYCENTGEEIYFDENDIDIPTDTVVDTIYVYNDNILERNYLFVNVYGFNSEYIEFLDYHVKVDSLNAIAVLTKLIYKLDNNDILVDINNVDDFNIDYDSYRWERTENTYDVSDSKIIIYNNTQLKSTTNTDSLVINVKAFETDYTYFKFNVNVNDNPLKSTSNDTLDYYFFDMTKGEVNNIVLDYNQQGKIFNYTSPEKIKNMYKFALKYNLKSDVESNIIETILQ